MSDYEDGLNPTEAARLKELEMLGSLSDSELVELANLRAKINPDDPDREVDIDQSEDIPEEIDYLKQLEDYFDEVENKYGIAAANQARQKIIASKQLEYFIDAGKWNMEILNMTIELYNQQLELIQKTEARTQQLFDKTEEILAKNAEVTQKMYERFVKALNDDEVRSQKLDEFTREIMELKRKKWIREDEDEQTAEDFEAD